MLISRLECWCGWPVRLKNCVNRVPGTICELWPQAVTACPQDAITSGLGGNCISRVQIAAARARLNTSPQEQVRVSCSRLVGSHLEDDNGSTTPSLAAGCPLDRSAR